MNKEVLYQVVKDIYTKNKVFNKSALDFRLLVFNERFKNLFTKYKTTREKVLNLDKIAEQINLYLGVSKIEKKRLGEVFTPFKLIDKMLDTLPKEVWSNPYFKWLDPANGISNFPIRIIQRLFISLENYKDDKLDLTDDDVRLKYIIEEMIYMCDIQTKNNFLTTLLIGGINSEYKINLYTRSFLKEGFDYHMKEVWGIDKFNIIISNSPYHLKVGKSKSISLWDKFVKKYFTIVENNGYICNVHPSGWRNIGMYSDISLLFKRNNILHLSIFDEKSGIRYFKAETRFDYYTINIKYDENFLTEVIDQNNNKINIDLKKLNFIPNSNFEKLKKIIAKDNEDRIEILSNSSYHTQREHLSKNKDNKYKYPCIYTVKKNDILTKWWSSRNDKGHFGVTKLVWSNFRITSAGSFIDKDGEYGLTQFSYAIVDDYENLKIIKTIFDSKEFRDIMESCSISDMKINPKIISTFKKEFWKEFI